MRRRAEQIIGFTAKAGATALALAAAALAVVVLAAVLIIQSTTAARMEERAAQAAAAAQRVTVDTLALLQAVTDAETGQRGYLLTGQREYLQPYANARTRGDVALTSLAAASQSNPDLAQHVPVIRDMAETRLRVIDRTIELAQAGRRDEALSILPQGRDVMSELRGQAEVLVARAEAHEAAVRAERRRFDRQTRLLQVGLAAGTVLALIIAIASLVLERVSARRNAEVQARLNEELRNAHRMAEEADQAKSRFLATASHDMRQPLHALALYIAALDRRVESPQAREILSNMDGAVRSMTRLFTALLDLARLEAGVLKPEPADFAIGELLHEVADHSVDQRGVKSVIRVIDTDLHVRSDPDLLEIALRNLASNAVKHSKGGRVLLGCRRVGDEVRIEVHDDGQGIPADQLQRLFSEFVRGEHAGSAEGIGLGLAIVERMAKLLGHRLAVRSEVGRGTTFAITVPRSATQVRSQQAAEPASLAALDGARILVADDEPLALDAMRHALEDAGASVSMADSAQGVRDLNLEARYDLYVFDLNLGRDDGLELAREVSEREGGGTRVLIVTGATTPEVLAQLRDAGRDWLTKPLTAAALTAKVSEILARP